MGWGSAFTSAWNKATEPIKQKVAQIVMPLTKAYQEYKPVVDKFIADQSEKVVEFAKQTPVGRLITKAVENVKQNPQFQKAAAVATQQWQQPEQKITELSKNPKGIFNKIKKKFSPKKVKKPVQSCPSTDNIKPSTQNSSTVSTGLTLKSPESYGGPMRIENAKLISKATRFLPTSDNALNSSLEKFNNHYQQNKARYESVSKQTGFPPELIAALHWREGSGNFNTMMSNGSSLDKKSTIVPYDGPYKSWEESAVFMLNSKKNLLSLTGLDKEPNDLVALATTAELWNGKGYYNKGVPSPYVYSGTDVYSKGKYVADGKYDPNTIDKQIGVLPMLVMLKGTPNTPKSQSPSSKSQPVVSTDNSSSIKDPKFDGKHPAVGTDKINKGSPVTAPFTNATNNRSKDNYENVIKQFAVENNPRYKQDFDSQGKLKYTYCNIFVWDVTKAMNAEIPHRLLNKDGKEYELNANANVDWLRKNGSDHGWKKVDEKKAQELANMGQPVVATWQNIGGTGHIAMVKPSEDPKQMEIMIAQAGATNSNSISLSKGFGKNKQIEFWGHD